MVFAAKSIVLGGISFSPREAATLQAGLRQGATVRSLRSLFRTEFGRGLPSEAFTAVRRTLTQAELAGVRLARLQPGQRLGLRNIPRLNVRARSGRFVMTGRVTARIRSTGETIERYIRFTTDERPSLDLFNREAQRILDLGVQQIESEMETISTGGLRVIEQVEV